MELSLKPNYIDRTVYRKKSYLVLASGKFLKALGSKIETCSVFLPFIFTFEQCVIELSVNVSLESHFIAQPGEIWSLKVSNKTSQFIILII